MASRIREIASETMNDVAHDALYDLAKLVCLLLFVRDVTSMLILACVTLLVLASFHFGHAMVQHTKEHKIEAAELKFTDSEQDFFSAMKLMMNDTNKAGE